MSNAIQCPDCNEAMEAGLIPDHRGLTFFRTAWFPGEGTEKSIFGISKPEQVNIDEETGLAVITFRCPKCGLLREFARDPIEQS